MPKGRVENEHGEHGWFVKGPKSYASLLKRSEAVKVLAQSYPLSSRDGNLYKLQKFLEINNLGPDEFLNLGDEQEIKRCLQRAIFQKHEEGSYASARRMFYAVKRFLELNGKDIKFSKAERRMLLKRKPKKIAKQYIPTREDIYRMVDAVPDKGPRQQSRARAILLCLWQSGVRASYLCTWAYGMVKDQLYPEVKAPVTIKVVANREDVYDCAEDTKLSAYNVGYYYTFLHREGAEALRAYLDERKKSGWIPNDSDLLFVTEGTASKGDPLESRHLNAVVKNCAEQIGIDPESIWTHCFRKAFRKSLYRGGIDPDVAEALMGHKLSGSRGSYFDYHDLGFARDQYMLGYWERLSIDRIRQLEDEVARLRKGSENLETNSKTKEDRIANLEKTIQYLQSGEYFRKKFDELIEKRASTFTTVGRTAIYKIPKHDVEQYMKLRKQGYKKTTENDEWIVMEKEVTD